MSLQSKLIAAAKRAKHAAADRHAAPAPLSPVRRIERVALGERVCAMTFDDGPCQLPPSHGSGERSLTLTLLEILEAHNARGTFDVIGDTADNYPDEAGKEGTAAWGGVRYDHYPDIRQDQLGGALHGPALIDRMLSAEHAVTNHTYRHILYGKKNVIYGKRAHLDTIDEVIADLRRLHDLLRERHGYTMTLSRPPHYVDQIPDGFSSYDAYAVLGYQYMAASFDGAGWLPLDGGYEAEVAAMTGPMEALLAEDPDALCGQIIFQKDGFNMARRTPVADGLEQQLRILDRYGYRVVTVPALLELSPFADVLPDDPCAAAGRALDAAGLVPAFRDNTLRPDAPMTAAELYQTLYGRAAVLRAVEAHRPEAKPYAAAAALAVRDGLPAADANAPVTAELLQAVLRARGKESPILPVGPLKRRDILPALAAALG